MFKGMFCNNQSTVLPFFGIAIEESQIIQRHEQNVKMKLVLFSVKKLFTDSEF